jgi:hypothetical protein
VQSLSLGLLHMVQTSTDLHQLDGVGSTRIESHMRLRLATIDGQHGAFEKALAKQ